MNSQRVLTGLLCKYHMAVQCKRFQADKLLGISYSSTRRFAKISEVSKNTKVKDHPPLGDSNTQNAYRNKKYAIQLIMGVGFLVASMYTALKTGYLKVNVGPTFQKYLPHPSDEAENENVGKDGANEDEEEEEEEIVFPDVNIPEHIPYLIIGAGTSSVSAFRAIKSKDPSAKVLVISAEGKNPYMRPPLSKEFWYNDDLELTKKFAFKQWNGKERSVYFEHEEFYQPIDTLMESEYGGISIVYGKRAVKIDAAKRIVYLNDGKEIGYEKCLIATGGRPKSLPVFDDASEEVRKKTTLFRSLADFKRLHKVVEKGKRVAIIGGGFLGSELACSLGFKVAKKGKGSVLQIYPESGNMKKVLPDYLSDWSTRRVNDEGVEIITNSYVKSAVSEPGGKIKLVLNSDEEFIVDYVVVAVGLEPNVELALSSGLELDENHGGFRVNAEMEARSNLWVAGDASCFYDIKLGRRRVEHHDHAVVSGRLAGENMTGAGKPYWHQSMFWSDLGPEIGYEAIGIVDSSLPTVGVFAKATEKDTPKAVVEATGESLRSETENSEVIEKESTLAIKNGKTTSESVPSKAEKVESTAEDANTDTISTFESDSPTRSLIRENYGKGVIFYLRDHIVVGLVLWNVYNKMPIARRIIKEAKVYDDLNELAKLFELHKE